MRIARPSVPAAALPPRPPQPRWTPTPARRARPGATRLPLPRAAEKLHTPRSLTRTESVTARHAPSPQPVHPANARWGPHTGSPSQTPSSPCSRPVSHSTRDPSPQSLRPSVIPPGKWARGPQLSFPLAAPTLPQSSSDTDVAGRPSPYLRPGSRSPLPSPRQGLAPSHLATAAAAVGAHRSPCLHWRRGPGASATAPASCGAAPRKGRGQGLPDSHTGHWLAEAAPPWPIAARGRGLLGWGAWAEPGGRFDRPEPPASSRRPPAGARARRAGGRFRG